MHAIFQAILRTLSIQSPDHDTQALERAPVFCGARVFFDAVGAALQVAIEAGQTKGLILRHPPLRNELQGPQVAPNSLLTRSRGGPATGRCGGHTQVSRQAKHYAHKGINALSCDKAFQNPRHSAKRERKYVQQHIRICTHGVKTGLG